VQIAFWGNTRGKAGVTSNMAAVSALLAMEMKIKTILFENHISIHNLEHCFWEYSYDEFIMETPFYYHHQGIDQVMKRMDSNIKMQEVISDAAIEPIEHLLYYIPQSNTGNKEVFEYELNRILERLLKELQNFAEFVLIDTAAADNLTTKVILESSDLIIMNVCQDPYVLADCFSRYSSIRDKCLYLMGNYDKYSRYSIKYVMRLFDIPKQKIAVIPYNTAFRDALSIGKTVPFLSRNMACHRQDENYYFMWELKRACQLIIKAAQNRKEGKIAAVS